MRRVGTITRTAPAKGCLPWIKEPEVGSLDRVAVSPNAVRWLDVEILVDDAIVEARSSGTGLAGYLEAFSKSLAGGTRPPAGRKPRNLMEAMLIAVGEGRTKSGRRQMLNLGRDAPLRPAP